MLDLDKMAEVAREYQRAADRPRPLPPLMRSSIAETPFTSLLSHDFETVRQWLVVLFGIR